MCFPVDSKKKVLFVISNLGVGGAERVLVNLINHLNRNRYESLLVIFENILDLQRDLHFPIKIVCLNKRSRWDFLKLIFRLGKVICDYNPDTVLSFLHYTNIVVVLSTLFLRRKYTLLLSERSYPRKYLAKAKVRYLRRWLINFTYKKANRIIAVSKDIKQVLKEDFNVQPEKIKIIYNPIPLEEIRYKSQEEVEHPFFKDDDVRVIISAGRLVELKGFDRLLKAFSLVREKQTRVRLIILGKGILQRELERLALQLNINNFVSFVGYKYNPYAWISKADIFVLPSDYEGFPNVLIEAMACGTPIISTDCPSGPREIIINGKNGILVPPADEKAMAEAMLNLLRNKNLRKQLSEEGGKRAKDFRIEKILPQYEELF